MAQLIDGKGIAETIRAEIKITAERMKDATGVVPGLATVLVGERRDSQTYVRMKRRQATECGFKDVHVEVPADVSEDELIAKVAELNADPAVHGILVQLPLPAHINERRVLEQISLEKDVDGFHPMHAGMLAQQAIKPGVDGAGYVPCTPLGCIELLDRTGIEIRGKHAVVLGRSKIVGLPVALLLLQRDATVTICHSKTQNLEEELRRADIVVAAIGRAEFVRGAWLKPGAVVIDVGINSVDDASTKQGYRLVGDVNFAEAREVASYITPVPGGVGPMTIAMLLKQTLYSAQRVSGFRE